jgi:hypothetical protein
MSACAHCGGPVHPSTAWLESLGFGKPRKEGGQNVVYGRRSTGRVLCGECGGRLKRGLLRAEDIGKLAGQESLL